MDPLTLIAGSFAKGLGSGLLGGGGQPAPIQTSVDPIAQGGDVFNTYSADSAGSGAISAYPPIPPIATPESWQNPYAVYAESVADVAEAGRHEQDNIAWWIVGGMGLLLLVAIKKK